jgi:hypothetical protein
MVDAKAIFGWDIKKTFSKRKNFPKLHRGSFLLRKWLILVNIYRLGPSNAFNEACLWKRDEVLHVFSVSSIFSLYVHKHPSLHVLTSYLRHYFLYVPGVLAIWFTRWWCLNSSYFLSVVKNLNSSSYSWEHVRIHVRLPLF